MSAKKSARARPHFERSRATPSASASAREEVAGHVEIDAGVPIDWVGADVAVHDLRLGLREEEQDEVARPRTRRGEVIQREVKTRLLVDRGADEEADHERRGGGD